MSRRRVSGILVGAGIFVFPLIYFIQSTHPVQYLHAQSTSPLTVTIDDIVQAGFTDPVALPAQAQRFQAPELYFRVAETVAKTHPEWGDAANLLNVFVRNMHDVVGWTYAGDQMKTQEYSGRTSISVFTRDYYIVVIGPDVKKVLALANILKIKFP